MVKGSCFLNIFRKLNLKYSYFFLLQLILFLAAQVVSIILALGTNKIKFFAIRVAANATLTTFLICVFEYSMSRLLIEATKSYNRNYGDDNSKKNLDAKPIAESKYDINKSNSLQGKNSKLDLNKDRNAINPFQNCPNVEPKIQIKVSDSVQKMPNPSVREVVKDNLKNSTRDFQKCLQLSSKNLSFKYKHGESETESCDEKDSMEHRITVDKIRFARTFSEGGEASEEQKQLESGEAKSIQSLRHPSKSQNRSLELYNSSPGVMSLNSSLPFGNSTRKAMVRADEQTKRMGSLGIQVQEKQSKSTYFERKAKRQAKDKNTIRKLSFTIWFGLFVCLYAIPSAVYLTFTWAWSDLSVRDNYDPNQYNITVDILTYTPILAWYFFIRYTWVSCPAKCPCFSFWETCWGCNYISNCFIRLPASV
mmetsp:Transcript_13468/g.18659  ORF Transcript_13468/g.18659 Transcript_13468/m.18659 type:complete len:422 (-) Transcript_13468:261-1526(-)